MLTDLFSVIRSSLLKAPVSGVARASADLALGLFGKSDDSVSAVPQATNVFDQLLEVLPIVIAKEKHVA